MEALSIEGLHDTHWGVDDKMTLTGSVLLGCTVSRFYAEFLARGLSGFMRVLHSYMHVDMSTVPMGQIKMSDRQAQESYVTT